MLYFDTSFLTPLLRAEATSKAINQFFQEQAPGSLTISHWTRVEFSSLLARDVRMGVIAPETAHDLDAQFEAIIAHSFDVILPDAADFNLCKRYLQRFDTGLRGGDALHLAIASNHEVSTLYSLDKRLLKAGRLLSLPVESGIRTR